MSRLSLLPVLFVVCLWMGCGKSETVVAPDGSKATVTEKGVTMKGPNGETIQFAADGGASLPAGFPDTVPIYPGAKIITSAKTNEAMTVALTTTDKPKNISEFYGEKLKANGWDIELTADTPNGGVVSAKKGDTTCTVASNQSDDQTTISIGVVEEKKN